jgi:hypothetical protein
VADDEEEWEEHAYYTGTCTCPPECPNHDPDATHGENWKHRDGHSWGGCGEQLPDGSECPCEAGWEE